MQGMVQSLRATARVGRRARRIDFENIMMNKGWFVQEHPNRREGGRRKWQQRKKKKKRGSRCKRKKVKPEEQKERKGLRGREKVEGQPLEKGEEGLISPSRYPTLGTSQLV